MLIEYWPIDRPRDYPTNARKWTAKAIEKVAMSLREYGWRQPVVVDSEGVIVIGHLRRTAARHLGMTEVPVHVATGLSPEKIRGLRLADNRTHEESDWNLELLAAEFGELKPTGFDLANTGFTLPQIRDTMFPKAKGERRSTSESGLEFRLVIDCADERQQSELMGRLKAEGLTCRALIS